MVTCSKSGRVSKEEKRFWVRIIGNEGGEERRTVVVADGNEQAKVTQHELDIVPKQVQTEVKDPASTCFAFVQAVVFHDR